MNPTFNIRSSQKTSAGHVLYIEAGEYGISFIVYEAESNTFTDVVVYHFPKEKRGVEFNMLIETILTSEPLLEEIYDKTYTIWSFNESVLLPDSLENDDTEKDMLDLVFGDISKEMVKKDFLTGRRVKNVYRVKKKAYGGLTNAFPQSEQTHQFTLLAGMETNSDCLYCIIYPDQMVVMLKKRGDVQLVKNIPYSIPEDVAFHLLNICNGFDMDIKKLTFVLSGMVDEGSNLYREVFKYFLVVEFGSLPVNYNYSEGIMDHPSHYFSHLFTQARCV